MSIYEPPSLTELGSVEQLTGGTGWTNLDSLFGDGDDGNPWGIGGGSN